MGIVYNASPLVLILDLFLLKATAKSKGNTWWLCCVNTNLILGPTRANPFKPKLSFSPNPKPNLATPHLLLILLINNMLMTEGKSRQEDFSFQFLVKESYQLNFTDN